LDQGADTFQAHLLEVLRAHPVGLSEHELITALDARGEDGFGKQRLRDNLSLFQTHFLLFHSLYALREKLIRQGDYGLEISALKIQLLSLNEEDAKSLGQHDPLRDYYLDLKNLENTTPEEVEQLLSSFWQRYLSNDERREALDTLGLKDPVDWPTIKQQHRRLAMEHHPDRGGDEVRLQAINTAMDKLARSYKS
jgi:DnaJ-domain-containing protein 1